MKLLRICQETPFPPTDGVRIEPFHITKHLAMRGHEITLMCFQSDDRDVTPLQQWCELHTITFRGCNTPLNLLKGALQKFPINYVKYRDSGMLSRILELVRQRSFDAVIVDYSALGWYALQLRALFQELPIITRWHNLDTLVWERWSSGQAGFIRRRLAGIQTQFVRKFTATLASASTACVSVGAKDAELLREMVPTARVEFIPAGVDVEHYSPRESTRTKNVLFMASGYKWHANWDAVKWLYESIMPLIWRKYPETKLYVTGGEWRSEMRMWACDERIVLTGFVPDEREILSECSVLAVPMRMGGGIKLKILTALSMKLPVVTTPAGAEGIAGLQNGVHCMVRDSASAFAEAVIELLGNPLLRETFAAQGSRLVRERYNWPVLAHQWEELLLSVAPSSYPALSSDAVLAT